MTLAELLQDAVRGAGLSYRAVAKRAGVSQSSLTRAAQSRGRDLGEDALVRVAHALSLDPVYLLAAAGRLPRDVVAYLTARPDLVQRLAVHAACAAAEDRETTAASGEAGEGAMPSAESGGAAE